jgi:hypothetical protein
MTVSATCAAWASAFGSMTVYSSSECARKLGPRPIVTAGMPSIIGRLASVLLVSISGFRPKALTAAETVWTSGVVSAVLPHGLSPISFGSATIFPSVVDRVLFSSSVAARTIASN